MPVLLFVMISGIWGSSFILMKKASFAYGPITIGGMRLLCGLLVLGAIQLLRGSRWRPRGADWGYIAAIVSLSYAWPYCLQPYLVAHYGSGFIGMMVAFVPLLTILAQIPLLRLRPQAMHIIGVLGGLACLYLVMEDGHERAVPISALLLAVTVPAGYAIGNTLIKRRFTEAPTMALTTWCLLFATLAVMPVALFQEGMPSGDHIVSASAAIVVLGVLGTGAAIAGLYHLIRIRGPLWAGMVTYVIPLGAIGWGWVDSEQVTLLQCLAMAGVLAMVALVQFGQQPNTAHTGSPD
ncbi:MAG: DMT family transporter [Planctomycetota bacterium]|nr:DMT family transporter [Planctomycetota bacterium]